MPPTTLTTLAQRYRGYYSTLLDSLQKITEALDCLAAEREDALETVAGIMRTATEPMLQMLGDYAGSPSVRVERVRRAANNQYQIVLDACHRTLRTGREIYDMRMDEKDAERYKEAVDWSQQKLEEIVGR